MEPSALEQCIEREYQDRKHPFGWRLLYSPPAVLNGARVAFIGLNPGGDHCPPDHPKFAMDSGSAYVQEEWGASAGENKLQRQVRALFDRVGEDPSAVLAGNLVPFRSPSWAALSDQKQALQFGVAIWQKILDRAKPELVIAMGSTTYTAVKSMLNVGKLKRIPVKWGNVTGERGRFNGGIYVGLPHLSRFAIMKRAESQNALRQLFK